MLTVVAFVFCMRSCATNAMRQLDGFTYRQPTAKRFWAYDDEVVEKELTKCKARPPFNHSASVNWFGTQEINEQEVPSGANADTKDGTLLTYFGPAVYRYEAYRKTDDPNLPFSDITDNTESISAFSDILDFLKPKCFLVDIGGGRFDTAKKWVKKKRPDVTMHVADPFNRRQAHNLEVQNETETRKGADVVTSMSVLNVVAELSHQAAHVWLVFQVLKPGGLAIFKAWAGVWPTRGTRQQVIDGPVSATKDSIQRMAQNNAFAEAYKPLIEKVFGEGNVFADSTLNLLVAQKRA